MIDIIAKFLTDIVDAVSGVLNGLVGSIGGGDGA